MLTTGCNNIKKYKDNDNAHTDSISVFKYPDIPIMIISEKEKMEYLAEHYWDNLNSSDSALVNSNEVSQKRLIDFISILKNISYSEDNIRKAICSFCIITSQKNSKCSNLIDNIEKYLYDPNSPLYNEYLYRIYLEEKLQLMDKNNPLSSSYKFKIELLSRNNIGSIACNFKFTLPNKQTSSLYETEIKTQYLILVFYDPECNSCHETMFKMFNDNILNLAIKMNKVTVMAVYTNGNDKVWENNLKELPSKWITCNDNLYITNHALYDLKAMPTIYLLSSEKIVLIKDASYSEIQMRIKEVV